PVGWRDARGVTGEGRITCGGVTDHFALAQRVGPAGHVWPTQLGRRRDDNWAASEQQGSRLARAGQLHPEHRRLPRIDLVRAVGGQRGTGEQHGEDYAGTEHERSVDQLRTGIRRANCKLLLSVGFSAGYRRETSPYQPHQNWADVAGRA